MNAFFLLLGYFLLMTRKKYLKRLYDIFLLTWMEKLNVVILKLYKYPYFLSDFPRPSLHEKGKLWSFKNGYHYKKIPGQVCVPIFLRNLRGH